MKYINKKGFTLIEILLVVALMGILATVVFVNMSGSKTSTQEKKFLSELAVVLPVIPLCKEAGDTSIRTPGSDSIICDSSTTEKYPKDIPTGWSYGNFSFGGGCTQVLNNMENFVVCVGNPSINKGIKCTRVGCVKVGW